MKEERKKCDWNGQYSKDNNKNLSFWCIYCGKERGLEKLGKVYCDED